MRHPDEGAGRLPGDAEPGGSHLDEGTIHAWIDGALDAAESARVERHALECAACAALVAEARGLVAAASRILTRLDDVPAGVVPAGAAGEAQPRRAAAPAPEERIVGRRRRWTPAAWGLSTAAAAAIVMILVARQGVDREALLESSAPLGTVDSAAPSAPAVPGASAVPPPAPALEGAQSLPPRSDEREASDASGRAAAAPRGADAATGGTGASLPANVVVAGDSAVARAAAPPLQARAAAADPAPGEARAEADRAAPLPPADLAGAARQGIALRERAEKSAVRDVAADSPTVEEAFVAAPAPTDAAAAPEAMRLARPGSDSATRAALPRRLGLGSRILGGAQLVSSAIDTTARPVERRSIYALEDGAIVTLVERASIVALEAVVAQAAGADARPGAARSVRPRVEAPSASGAAAPAPAPAGAGRAGELADGSRILRPAPGETVLVRPDGIVRLDWREIGVELSLEGRVSIERIRELKSRVGP